MRAHVSISELTAERPARLRYGRNAACAVTPISDGTYRLLVGPVPGAKPAVAAVIEDRDDIAVLDAFGDATSEPPRLQQIQIACLLGAAGLRTPEIAALLLLTNLPEVWRWSQLHRAHSSVRASVLDGSLAPGHLRALLPLALADQETWALRARRGRWSVRKLAAMIKQESEGNPTSADAQPDPNMEAFQSRLSSVLGTEAILIWETGPKGLRELSLAYHDIESLKGILQSLSRGPDHDGVPAIKARQLRIELLDSDDLHSLTGHLTGEL